jgi:hypothetical protein
VSARPLCAAAALALLAGCPHIVRPTDPWRDARGVLAAHDSMRARVHELSATARADRRGGPEGRLRGRITLVVQRPDHVRFEVMTQLGPVATLTSDGTRFALADQRDGRFLTGPSCPENIERLTGLRLDARDATSVLLGSAPRIDAVRQEIVVDRETGHYVVTLHAQDSVTETLELGIREVDERAPPMQQRLRLVRAEVHERDGTLRWRATYGDFRVIDGVAVPLTVRFEDEVHRTDTLLKLDDVILDHEPPPDAFVQEPVPGLRVEEVGCGG